MSGLPGIAAKDFLGVGWSLPLQLDRTADVALAEYEEDVRQAILIILRTERGERVAMRPDFGAGLREFVFRPVSTTTMALIRQRVHESLVLWEPRIEPPEVEITAAGPDRSRLDIAISYRIRATNAFHNLVFPFFLGEGRE